MFLRGTLDRFFSKAKMNTGWADREELCYHSKIVKTAISSYLLSALTVEMALWSTTNRSKAAQPNRVSVNLLNDTATIGEVHQTIRSTTCKRH